MDVSARVILHIDFDSYYTQVEMKRLGIPRETPCAVQQWEGLIAVNYPARGRGVTRHMRVKEAQKLCPEMVLVHVETIGAEGSSDAAEEAAAAAAVGTAAAGVAAAAAAAGSVRGQETRRLTQKACLERYRRSTAEVLVLLHREAPAAVIEKASIDEVYMDVTAMVDKELQDRSGAPASPVDAFGWGSIVVGGPLDVSSEFERRLAVGAGIACRLRGMLNSQMGYTASAGIAANKLLAKIGSGMHKPNQQTLIPPRSAQQVMQDLPLSKLRGFGGKLGEQLEGLGCTTAGQVQQLSHSTLAALVGAERATAIEQAVRGVSCEPVQERERPKSMLAAKSFNATSDLAALQGWFNILAQELAGRMTADAVQFRRRPKNLVVHYRGGAHTASERSKCCSMPRFAGGEPSADVISEAAFALFRSKCASEALPCSRLAISATDFADLPAANGSAITRFLVPRGTAGAAGSAGGGGEGGSGGGQAGVAAAGKQQQQQQLSVGRGSSAPHGAKQQRQVTAAAAAAAASGASRAASSISSLFERAQKRQRLDSQGEQQQQQEEEQQEQQQQLPQPQPQLQQQEQKQQEQQQPRPGAPEAADERLYKATPELASGALDACRPEVAAAAAEGAAAETAAAGERGGIRGGRRRGSLVAAAAEASIAGAGAGGAAREAAAAAERAAAWEAPAVPREAAWEAPAAATGAAAASAAAAAAAAGEPASGAAAEDAAVLAGVDMEEQKRILRDIEMLQRLNNRPKPAPSTGNATGRSAGVAGGSKGSGGSKGGRAGGKQQQQGRMDRKQPGISAFFSKKPGS